MKSLVFGLVFDDILKNKKYIFQIKNYTKFSNILLSLLDQQIAFLNIYFLLYRLCFVRIRLYIL